MRTPTVLCVLLSLAVASAFAQPSKVILEDELATEARLFSEAYADLQAARERQASAERLEDAAERVNRHRRNMAELAREIARGEANVPDKTSAPKGSADWLIPVEPAKRRHPDWLVPGGKDGR